MPTKNQMLAQTHYQVYLLNDFSPEKIPISFFMINDLQLGVFLLAFIVLDGSWVGFWLVRKCILTEEGLVDSRTARFVESSIGILAGLLIIQVVYSFRSIVSE